MARLLLRIIDMGVSEALMTERRFLPPYAVQEFIMPSYRFYLLDADNRIIHGVDVECVDDEAARIAGCRWLMWDAYGEVWSGQRFVGRISNLPSATP